MILNSTRDELTKLIAECQKYVVSLETDRREVIPRADVVDKLKDMLHPLFIMRDNIDNELKKL